MKEPGARVELASSCWGRVELASSCWERGCAHFLHTVSSVSRWASNSPRGQGHETLYVPTVTTAVQRPDAIMREKDGAGCCVVLILAAEFWRNGRKEKKEEKEKEEAMLRKV